MSEKAAEIASSITTTDLQLVIVDAELRKLSLDHNRPDALHKAFDISTSQGIMKQEHITLQLCSKLLEALRLRSEKEIEHVARKEREQSTTITFRSNNSGFQLGTNPGSISNFFLWPEWLK